MKAPSALETARTIISNHHSIRDGVIQDIIRSAKNESSNLNILPKSMRAALLREFKEKIVSLWPD